MAGASRRSFRKFAPDRGPLGPDVMLDRFEIERLLAAEGRIEAWRPNAHGAAPVIHRSCREPLAPKQEHGGLERRVAIKFPWPPDSRHRHPFCNDQHISY